MSENKMDVPEVISRMKFALTIQGVWDRFHRAKDAITQGAEMLKDLPALRESNTQLRSLLAHLGKHGCWCGQPPGALQGQHSMLCRAIQQAVG